ncbi:MAG: EAL domain-containing protein [Pseudomonadota bacterium]
MSMPSSSRVQDREEVYRSLVISLFSENKTILTGAIASAAAMAMTAHHLDSLIIWLIAFATLVVGVGRFVQGRKFAALHDPAKLSAQQIRKWDISFSIGAIACTSLLGAWCFLAALPGDPFPRFVSVVVTFANIVGICTRSSALPRLVNFQLISMVVPMVAGLYITGDEYAVLGVLLIPFMISLQRIAQVQRRVLLNTIAERQRAEHIANNMHTALENIPQGVVMFDADGSLEVSNGHIQQMTQRTARSLQGTTTDRMLTLLQQTGNVDQAEIQTLRSWLKNSTERSFNQTLHLGHDKKRVVRFHASRMDKGGFIGTFEDITKEVAAESRIEHMTRYDRLTGLINRSYVTTLLSSELQTCPAAKTCAVLIVDLLKFKKISDMTGPQTADLILCEIAQRISRVVDPKALCARFSSDEFMVVLRSKYGLDEARHVADKLLDTISEPIVIRGHSITLSSKIGIALSDHDSHADGLIKQANVALAAAKASEDEAWMVFDEQIGKQLETQRQMEDAIRTALDNEAFELHYQPIVDLKNKKVALCEALVRWNDPQLGRVSPSQFLPLIEDMNLMDELGDWVIKTACHTCASWPGDAAVAVNLSAAQFRKGRLVSVIRDALDSSGLNPARLEIEVTETLMLNDVEAAVEQLNAVKALGVRVALDDFGTGYSSLSYMSKLPLDKVKIDRSFVTGVNQDPKLQLLITGIAALGHGLDLTVVVEGVETEMELRRLMANAQIDLIQGYYFSMPLDSIQTDTLFADQSDAMKQMLAKIPSASKRAA